MRNLAAFATLLAVATACGSDGSPRADETPGSSAPPVPNVAAAGSCAAAVSLNDKLYLGSGRLHEPVKFGGPTEGGVVPACNDTGASDEEDMPAALTSIEGVSPDVAVGMGDEVYLGPGYLTESPLHPLHGALYRTESDETAEFRCEADTRSLTGRVDFTPGFGTVIRLRGLDDPSSALLRDYDGVVFVDGGTEYAGLDRDGIPYLEEGTEVSVAARPCEGDSDARKLVVTRMTAAP